MEIFLENIKREKRAIYMVQIRKENNEKLFTMKRNNLLKEFENHKLSSTDIEENFEVSFYLFFEKRLKFFVKSHQKKSKNSLLLTKRRTLRIPLNICVISEKTSLILKIKNF